MCAQACLLLMYLLASTAQLLQSTHQSVFFRSLILFQPKSHNSKNVSVWKGNLDSGRNTSSSPNKEYNETFTYAENSASKKKIKIGTSSKYTCLFAVAQQCQNTSHAVNTAHAIVVSVTLQFSQATAVVLLLHKCCLQACVICISTAVRTRMQHWFACCVCCKDALVAAFSHHVCIFNAVSVCLN